MHLECIQNDFKTIIFQYILNHLVKKGSFHASYIKLMTHLKFDE
jgi:hypothetical protein